MVENKLFPNVEFGIHSISFGDRMTEVKRPMKYPGVETASSETYHGKEHRLPRAKHTTARSRVDLNGARFNMSRLPTRKEDLQLIHPEGESKRIAKSIDSIINT